MPAFSRIMTLPQSFRTSDLLRLSQDAAFGHLQELGLGGVAEKLGYVWVITRVRGEILNPPDRTLRVETWPGKTRLGMMPRYCDMYNEDGTLAVRLLTVWVLADFRTRQMVQDPAVCVPDMTRGGEMPSPRSLARKLMPRVGGFMPAPGQIDGNGHMNNAAYLDAAEDSLPFPPRALSAFAVDYRAEILPGTQVTVYATEQENCVFLSGSCGEKEHFRMQLTYGEVAS